MKAIIAFVLVLLSLLSAWMLRPSESFITVAPEGNKGVETQTKISQTATLSNKSRAKGVSDSTLQASNNSRPPEPEPQLSTLWSFDPPRHPPLASETSPVLKKESSEPPQAVVHPNEDSTGQTSNASTTAIPPPSLLDPQPPTLPLDSIARLANSNLPAAINWAASLPESQTKEAAVLALGYEAARGQPVAAIELARSLPANRDRDVLVEHALNQWTVSDPAAAQAWVSQVEDPELRQKLVTDFAIASAENDPSSSATFTANSLPPGEDQDRAAVAIVQRWVQKSPLDAAAWVAQFPESPARDAAVQSLVALWTAQDRQAPLNWLQQLSEGNLRTLAFNTYSQALTRPATVNVTQAPILETLQAN